VRYDDLSAHSILRRTGPGRFLLVYVVKLLICFRTAARRYLCAHEVIQSWKMRTLGPRGVGVGCVGCFFFGLKKENSARTRVAVLYNTRYEISSSNSHSMSTMIHHSNDYKNKLGGLFNSFLLALVLVALWEGIDWETQTARIKAIQNATVIWSVMAITTEMPTFLQGLAIALIGLALVRVARCLQRRAVSDQFSSMLVAEMSQTSNQQGTTIEKARNIAPLIVRV
jgi:hypothetical protein